MHRINLFYLTNYDKFMTKEMLNNLQLQFILAYEAVSVILDDIVCMLDFMEFFVMLLVFNSLSAKQQISI